MNKILVYLSFQGEQIQFRPVLPANLLFCLLLFFVITTKAQNTLDSVEMKSEKKPAPVVLNGSLQINAKPGADIFINNSFKGKTNEGGQLEKPLTLKTGRYKVLIKYPEYEDYTEEVSIQGGKPSIINASLKSKYGYFVVSGIDITPDLKIELDNTIVNESNIIADTANHVISVKTTPGEHKLVMTKPGYLPFEKTVVAKEPDESSIVPFMAERKMSAILLKANPGARVYIEGEEKGTVSSDGELKIGNLMPGRQYKVKVELDNYQPTETDAMVEMGKESTVTVKLTPLPTSAAFEENFLGGLIKWNAPKEWQVQNAVMRVVGEGIGLPKNRRYRDSDVVFGLRIQQKGAAWVVRSQDDKNFYLFYLSGPEGQDPNKLSTYIVRNGVATKQQVDKIRVPINKNDDYRVYINVSGNIIKHWLKPTNTGEKIPIGFYQDAENSFSIGNIGFTGFDGADFLINSFNIIPTQEQK